MDEGKGVQPTERGPQADLFLQRSEHITLWLQITSPTTKPFLMQGSHLTANGSQGGILGLAGAIGTWGGDRAARELKPETGRLAAVSEGMLNSSEP